MKISREQWYQDIFRRMLTLKALFEKNIEKLALDMNMHRSELLLLLDVNEHPNTSLIDACTRCGLKKSAASKMIDRLQARGLIERQTCPTNLREVVLTVGPLFDQPRFCWNQASSILLPGISDYGDEQLLEVKNNINIIKRILEPKTEEDKSSV